MEEPKRFKLTRIEPKAPNVKIEGEGVSLDAWEFNPLEPRRYIISLEVGDMPPAQISMQLKRAHEQLAKIFKGNNFLVVPAKDGHPVIGIYEMEAVT